LAEINSSNVIPSGAAAASRALLQPSGASPELSKEEVEGEAGSRGFGLCFIEDAFLSRFLNFTSGNPLDRTHDLLDFRSE
jgi:hypothetical protein